MKKSHLIDSRGDCYLLLVSQQRIDQILNMFRLIQWFLNMKLEKASAETFPGQTTTDYLREQHKKVVPYKITTN